MRAEEFELACRTARAFPDVDPDVLLQLYGLYKQAVFGDATGPRPGILNLRAQAKFDAWAAHQGMTRDEAVKRYIAQVAHLGEDGAAAKISPTN